MLSDTQCESRSRYCDYSSHARLSHDARRCLIRLRDGCLPYLYIQRHLDEMSPHRKACSVMPSRSIDAMIDNSTCRIGETVRGTVVLDVPALQAERVDKVEIKLICSLRIGYFVGPYRFVRRIDIIGQSREIWKQKDDGEKSMRFGILWAGFEFRILDNAPCSFEGYISTCHVQVAHKMEVIEIRPGPLRWNTRVYRTITVLPPVPQARVRVTEQFDLGWTGPWTYAGTSKHIRRFYHWGTPGYVEALLTFPEFAFPVYSNVPFTLKVIAKSEPGDRQEKETWPTHTLRQSDIQFARYQVLTACLLSGTAGSNTKRIGGAFFSATMGETHFESEDRKWEMFEDGEGAEGRWVRTTVVKLTVRLDSPPDTHIDPRMTNGKAEVTIKHFLSVKVRLGAVQWLTIAVPLAAMYGSARK
ncbi:hypothetical protein DAEQUDRAFT_53447 [Daedalea quercina L-15889]|uniref:Arrestin-like N-terminal domain-containing protein n=1 Tax=Daedalea quercina L-15889 TaxID=1314783 RepID=A0A165L9W5_9APHY|nr:hypothetical protein DAEQUDRAFT_53447 [Daedalea quercina L-15889]